MKAALLVAPRKYEVREISDPDLPPDGLLLQVKTCGICGSDLRRWKEGPPTGSQGIIAGHEIAGVVLEIGRQVSHFSAGDRLAVAPDVHCGRCYYCQRGRYNLCDDLRLVGITPGYPGGFAEKMVLTGDILSNGIVHRMPEEIDFFSGALAEPLSSVLAAHDRVHTGLGDVVVVMGAGPIGCLHIVVAQSRGAQVILSEPSAPRRSMAQSFSPAQIVDPLNADLSAVVCAFTQDRGADIVICANPVASTQSQAIEIVRKGGRVVLFGGLPKSDPLTHLDANRIHYGEIEVMGTFSYHPAFHELALEVLRHQKIPAVPLITHKFSLDEINRAFDVAFSGEALKVIIEI